MTLQNNTELTNLLLKKNQPTMSVQEYSYGNSINLLYPKNSIYSFTKEQC